MLIGLDGALSSLNKTIFVKAKIRDSSSKKHYQTMLLIYTISKCAVSDLSY